VPTNLHPRTAAKVEEVTSPTEELQRDIEDGSRSDRRRKEPITVMAFGAVQPIGTLRATFHHGRGATRAH
jgi:hypothetical protein